jgi:PAS domain S-box-containing protein
MGFYKIKSRLKLNRLKLLILIGLFIQNLFALHTPQYIDLSKSQWEYRWSDTFPNQKIEGWQSIEYPSNPPNRNNKTNVWYRVKLPDILPKDPYVYIFSIDLISEVYFQDKKIYQFGRFDNDGHGKFEGWPWHLVKLPENSRGEYLYFRIYSDYPDIGLWGEISIASKGYHLEKMFDKDFIKLLIGAMASFIGVLIFILFLSNSFKIEFFFLGTLFLTQGIDLLLSTKVIQFYFNHPLLKQYLLAFCYFYVPVGIAAILEQFIGAGYFKIIRRIWQLHLLYIIVSFSGAIIGLYNVSSLYIYFDYIHYFFTLPILTGIILYAMYNGNRDVKIISIGFLILALSWLYSSLIAWGIISWQEHPGYIAVLICLSLFTYVVVRKVIFTQHIQKQKEEFESIFKYSKDGIAITDLKLKFLDFNDAFLEMTRDARDQLLEKNCIDLCAIEDKRSMQKVVQQVLKNGFIEGFEQVYLLKDGHYVDVNMTISLLPDKKRLLLVVKDMTESKLFERQSRLASMGEMIGNIAHQWRQPLSVISMSASGMKIKSEYDELEEKEIITYSDLIVQQTEYLSQTIDNFRDFIKENKEYQEISLLKVINQSLSLVEASMKNSYITLIHEFNDDLLITANFNELTQAFINIFNNSKDQLNEKIENVEDRFLFVSSKQKDENSLEIIIKDSGKGIDQKIIHRIFEPYFTTKHQSIGTGLGLNLVDKILRERYKGVLKVYNEEFMYNGKNYKGACFNIVLSNKNSDMGVQSGD